MTRKGTKLEGEALEKQRARMEIARAARTIVKREPVRIPGVFDSSKTRRSNQKPFPGETEQERLDRLREQGRRGGLANSKWRDAQERTEDERRRFTAAARAQLAFEDATEDMAAVIIRAAKGTGKFKDLLPKEQAQFALKVLEYGVGRPQTRQPDVLDDTAVPGLEFATPTATSGNGAGLGVNETTTLNDVGGTSDG